MGSRGLLRRGDYCSTDSRRSSTKNLHLFPARGGARRKILLREAGIHQNFAREDDGFSFADTQLTSRLAGGGNLLRLDTARRSEDRRESRHLSRPRSLNIRIHEDRPSTKSFPNTVALCDRKPFSPPLCAASPLLR